jgi:hypothetical protein
MRLFAGLFCMGVRAGLESFTVGRFPACFTDPGASIDAVEPAELRFLTRVGAMVAGLFGSV